MPTLFVSDLEASIAWYEQVLGFRDDISHG